MVTSSGPFISEESTVTEFDRDGSFRMAFAICASSGSSGNASTGSFIISVGEGARNGLARACLTRKKIRIILHAMLACVPYNVFGLLDLMHRECWGWSNGLGAASTPLFFTGSFWTLLDRLDHLDFLVVDH